MTTIEAFESGRKTEIPSSWDEMTPKEVRGVFRIFDETLRNGGSPLEFNIRVLHLLLGIKPEGDRGFAALAGQEYSRKDENIWRLCESCLGFLFVPGTCQLSFDSVANPLPWCMAGKRRLAGPADLLADLTFGEFRHASAALSSFFKSSDPSGLDECVAFLYRRPARKPNRAGRRVRPVEGGSVAKDIALAAKVGTWQKNLIMMWFAACLKRIQEGEISVDGEVMNMKLLFSGDGKGSGEASYGWSDLLVEIAKQGGLGTMEEVDASPLFSVLQIMWHNYKDNKRYEKASKARKS